MDRVVGCGPADPSSILGGRTKAWKDAGVV